MSLKRGTRLGAYEVLGSLGAGAMGEVYRARDPRLGREVAIKVIRSDSEPDGERRRRFEEEARAAGALNHPNVLAVFDTGLDQGCPFVVFELLEGETLRLRLERGSLPHRTALEYAAQICQGLAAAHDKGIVHRDLKPDNLFLTVDGRVKILDFGLAKLTQGLDQASPALGGPNRTATRPGLLLGTVAYMSPEQARGSPADARSDIFALGATLYEMLSARPAFLRASPAETLSAILTQDPEAIGPSPEHPMSQALDRILRHCLEKDPERRFQSARDLGFALSAVAGSAASRAGSPALPPRLGSRGLLIAGLALAAGAGVSYLLRTRARPPSPNAPLRLSVDLGADASVALGDGTSIALSGDGSTLAFVAGKEGGGQQIYLRRLDQETASPIPGTENASGPFFSPDGAWLGFFADSKLKKVATRGGAPVALCDSPDDRGGTWAEDGTIFFTPTGSVGGGVRRVSSEGGTPEPVTKVDPPTGVATDRWPQALRGGQAILFTSFHRTAGYDDASIVVQALGSARKTVHHGGYHGRYLRSGHLVYIHKGTLFAAPFNLDRLDVTGPAIPVLQGVMSRPRTGASQFTFSDDGLLAYLPTVSGAGDPSIQWLDAKGATEQLRASAADARGLRFSPDGRRLAMNIYDGTQHDVWVYEWERDRMSRLTFDPENDITPVWSPDGRTIAFSSARAGKTQNIYFQAADGTGEAQRLTESRNMQTPSSWHPQGHALVFEEESPEGVSDLMILPLQGNPTTGLTAGKAAAFMNSSRFEGEAAFSPDGRWLAYVSNESGRFEVFVRAFPGPRGKWQVSTGGGRDPTWSRTAQELFYRSADLKLMVARYVVERDSFRSEKERCWSATSFDSLGPSRAFDLHPDGRRFAVLKSLAGASETRRSQVTLVFNFADELRRVTTAGEKQ